MKNNDLGIITFNRALNYGAVLQAYALKCVCDDLGFCAHVVNYWREGKETSPKSGRINMTKYARKLLSLHFHHVRENAFAEFREKYLNESAVCANVSDIEKLNYAAYVIGSDQIWNFNITGGTFDPVYFGDFAENANKVIYAASAHDTPFPLKQEKEFCKLIGQTQSAISIRENRLQDYVALLTGKVYPSVLDPTLLAGREVMDKLTEGIPANKESYILIYQIDTNPASDISVKTLEKRFGCKVYTMTVPRIGSMHGRKGTASPEEFLSLLKGAEMIVTNSFHGIALSLLFEKQFFVYEHAGVMTRIDNLLDMVALDDRKVRLVKDIQPEKTIDYSAVNEKLEKLRESSYTYLKDALAGKKPDVLHKKQVRYQIPPMAERQKKDCSGCTACAQACPVQAISMVQDEEGFLYPVISDEKCIHCGLCDRLCGFVPKEKKPGDLDESLAYGVKHKDEQTRLTSRSGAAFIALSDLILQKGGAVYGAAFADHFEVEHIRAQSADERNRMKNAKYVQSTLNNTYAMVNSDLADGRHVLFSGTPCQVSGLLAYLSSKKTDQSKLITCDLVCHGVPSPAIWHDYVSYTENRYKNKIIKADFRDKEFGWDSHCESFVLENGKKIASRDYTDLFYAHLMFRPSCHSCYFASPQRISDITLADFWGIEKNDAEFNDNKGVSLVLINTEKGKELFAQAEADLDLISCRLENCIQPTLVKPSVPSVRRNDFWADYQKLEFGKLLRKYTTPQRADRRIKRDIKKALYYLHLRRHP